MKWWPLFAQWTEDISFHHWTWSLSALRQGVLQLQGKSTGRCFVLILQSTKSAQESCSLVDWNPAPIDWAADYWVHTTCPSQVSCWAQSKITERIPCPSQVSCWPQSKITECIPRALHRFPVDLNPRLLNAYQCPSQVSCWPQSNLMWGICGVYKSCVLSELFQKV